MQPLIAIISLPKQWPLSGIYDSESNHRTASQASQIYRPLGLILFSNTAALILLFLLYHLYSTRSPTVPIVSQRLQCTIDFTTVLY